MKKIQKKIVSLLISATALGLIGVISNNSAQATGSADLVASDQQSKVTYNFFNPEADEHFQLVCAPRQTVLTTKEVIQKKYDLPDPQDVTLIFSGKALRDGFVLDRLRIGQQNIVIHIKDRRTLLIYSGREFGASFDQETTNDDLREEAKVTNSQPETVTTDDQKLEPIPKELTKTLLTATTNFNPAKDGDKEVETTTMNLDDDLQTKLTTATWDLNQLLN